MIIPASTNLRVCFPKQSNYHIPEGSYRARIHKIVRGQRQRGNGCMDILRLVFELEVPGKENYLNLAKAEFPLHLGEGSELRNVLTRLLGKRAMADLSGREMDLQALVGIEVDVEIEHIITSSSENYDYPFVQVRDIQQRGGLIVRSPDPERADLVTLVKPGTMVTTHPSLKEAGL